MCLADPQEIEDDGPNQNIFYHCRKINWIEILLQVAIIAQYFCSDERVLYIEHPPEYLNPIWILPYNASAWMKKQKKGVSVKAEMMQNLVCTNRDCSFRGWGVGLRRELNTPNHRVWDVLYAFYELNFHFNTDATHTWKIIHSQLLYGTVTISRNIFTKKSYERFFTFSVLCNASSLRRY